MHKKNMYVIMHGTYYANFYYKTIKPLLATNSLNLCRLPDYMFGRNFINAYTLYEYCDVCNNK